MQCTLVSQNVQITLPGMYQYISVGYMTYLRLRFGEVESNLNPTD